MRARRGLPWRWLAIATICLWSLFPIYWTLNTSLTTNDAAQAMPAHYVPTPFTLTNYAQLFGLQGQANSSANLWPQISRSLINITVECVAATLLTLIIAVFSAYAFARMEFRLKTIILGTVIATLALPAYATLIPLYRMMSDAGLVNTYTGIVLVYASGFLPLAMWILYSYYSGLPRALEEAAAIDGLPRALEEAAAIDGASPLGTLFSIIVPLALPGITATAIITFLSAWGQFLFPLVLSSDITTQPLTVFITGLQTQHTVPYTLLNAAGVLCIIVPAAMVMFLNRYIISGILAGGVK